MKQQSGVGSRNSVLSTACILAAKNEQEKLFALCCSALQNEVPLVELYEALLQSYLFAGFPCALEALMTLQQACVESSVEWKIPAKEEFALLDFKERGEKCCSTIYTSAYAKMRERLGVISPDLDSWMILEGYGKTLSRSGLEISQRELCIVAMLGILGWERQLFSHIRGALNVGAENEAVMETLDCVSAYDEVRGAIAKEIAEKVLSSKL